MQAPRSQAFWVLRTPGETIVFSSHSLATIRNTKSEHYRLEKGKVLQAKVRADRTSALRVEGDPKSFTVRGAGCASTPRRRAEDAHLGARRGRRGGEDSVAAPSLLSSSRAQFPTARTCAARWPRPCPFGRTA